LNFFIGNSDVVLAVGFEKMRQGSLENMKENLPDRTPNNDKHVQVIKDTYGLVNAPLTCQMFGNAGREHMAKYGQQTKKDKKNKFSF
jgi:acetyl-CoA acetyltransferase